MMKMNQRWSTCTSDKEYIGIMANGRATAQSSAITIPSFHVSAFHHCPQ